MIHNPVCRDEIRTGMTGIQRPAYSSCRSAGSATIIMKKDIKANFRIFMATKQNRFQCVILLISSSNVAKSHFLLPDE